MAEASSNHHRRLGALIEEARLLPPLLTAVVFANDPSSVMAAFDAARLGLIDPVFYGPESMLRELAERANASVPGRVCDTGALASSAALEAVLDAGKGRVRAIMKGSLHTDELLTPVVAARSPIRGLSRMTHTFLFDLPRYHKLLGLTDAVINIAPDLRVKTDAINNAIRVLNRLGVNVPKVAIVAAVETVNPAIPATLDAAALVALAAQGAFGAAAVEGPFGFDNAICKAAADAKGINSLVAGDPDLLVVPDLNSGNILYKSLIYMGGGECAGIVLGANVPIVLTSRADSRFSRIASCALAGLAAN